MFQSGSCRLRQLARRLSTAAPTANSGATTPALSRRLNTKNLFVSELSPGSQANEIHHLFSRQGRVQSVSMNYTPTGQFAQTAVVRFDSYEQAEQALEEHRRHGSMLNGVHIKVGPNTVSGNPNTPSGNSTRAAQRGLGCQIFVSNLSFLTTAEQIKAAFSSFGTVADVNLFKREGRSMGMAKVLFARTVDAETAIKDLNEASFDGRTLFVKKDANYVSHGDMAPASPEAFAAQTEQSQAPSPVSETSEVKEPVMAAPVDADEPEFEDDDLMRSINAASNMPTDIDKESIDAMLREDEIALEKELSRQGAI